MQQPASLRAHERPPTRHRAVAADHRPQQAPHLRAEQALVRVKVRVRGRKPQPKPQPKLQPKPEPEPNPSPNPSPNPKRNTYARNRRWFDEQAAAGRRQLLVVGDSLGDLRCAEGVPDSFVVSRPSPSPSPSPAS